MSLRLHIWFTRAFTLIFGIGLLIDLWPLTASGPIGWLGLLFVLLIWSGFWGHNLCTSAALACPLCGRSYGSRILFQMRCPHCGGEVHQDAHSPKHIWVPTVLFVALLAGAVFYCRPLSFPDLTQVEKPIQITCIQNLPPIIKDYIAIPQQQTTQFTIEPDSPEMAELTEILSRYHFHRCFQTLSKTTAIEDIGDDSFFISSIDPDTLELEILSCRHLWLDGRVYHIGWFGDGQGQQLGAELAQVLGLP